tara:strand:- start:252 stop:905 length:654 start_codon:yes stop_codon:yes gene_type:complete
MAFFRAIDFNPSPRAGRIGRGFLNKGRGFRSRGGGRIGRGFPGMGRGFPSSGGIGGLLGRIVNRAISRPKLMPNPIRRPMPMPIFGDPTFGSRKIPHQFLPNMPMPNMPMPSMPEPMPMEPMPLPSMPPIRPGYIPQIDPVALQELQDRMANVSPPPVVPDRPQQFNPSFFRNLIDSTSEQKQAFERFQERMRNRDPDEPLKMRPYQPGRLGSRMIG